MPIKTTKRGVNHIKTLHTVTKASAKKNDTADFLELYMLEKEKQRLMSEESKILFRLDYVQNRLRIIQNIWFLVHPLAQLRFKIVKFVSMFGNSLALSFAKPFKRW